MILDDDHETSASFAALFELEGAISLVAQSGHNALALLESNNYDVLISDLDMPEMDGYEFIRKVCSGSRSRQIKAIAVIGHNREEDKRRVMEAGFDILVEKPVSFEALVAAVNDQCGNGKISHRTGVWIGIDVASLHCFITLPLARSATKV